MALILVATESTVLVADAATGVVGGSKRLDDRPTCLAADPFVPGRAWCGTQRGGVLRSDDAREAWPTGGLSGRSIMSIAASPARRDLIWVGTEPSEVWYSENAGDTWQQTDPLETLASSSEWSFP